MFRVSVVVPIYNIQDQLPACLKSIQAQSYRDLEIILVNDGSTDDSGPICDTFAKDDDRIRVVHKPNGGVSSARNAGIDKANGRFICFVDGDDLLHAEMIAFLVEIASSDQDIDIVACTMEQFYKEFDTTRLITRTPPRLISGNDALLELLYQRVINAPFAKLFKKELFEIVKFPAGIKIGEDLLTNITAFQKAKKVALTSPELYGYFVRPGSAMHSSTFEDRMVLIENLDRHLRTYESDRSLVSAFENRIFTEALYASITLPANSTRDKEQLTNLIRRIRKSVAKNPNVTAFYRQMALVSYISIWLPKYIIIMRKKGSATFRKLKQ